MSSIQNLVVNLVGNASSYIQALQQAASSTLGFQNQVESMAVALTQMLNSLGAVEAFSLFNKKMTESTSIMGALSDSMKREMQDVALNLSTKWAKAPYVMAESYYFLASAGFSARDSIAALEPVTKFAVAGAFDTSTAVTLATDAVHALGLEGRTTSETMQNLTRVTDVLVKADSLANATVRQFSESLTREAASSLKLYNKEVEEGVAVLMAYASQGIKGQHAGTVLGRMNRMLAKSTFEAAAAHKELGFNVFDPNTGAMRNYADIIADLERITKGLSNQQKASTLLQLGFEARVQQSILPLIGMSDNIRKYEKELYKAGGMTDEVANKQMGAFANQMANAWNSVKGLAIEIGSRFAPAVLALGAALEGTVKWLSSFPEWLKQTMTYVSLAIVSIGALTLSFKVLAAAIIYLKATEIGTWIAGLGPLITRLGASLVALNTSFNLSSIGAGFSYLYGVLGNVITALRAITLAGTISFFTSLGASLVSATAALALFAVKAALLVAIPVLFAAIALKVTGMVDAQKDFNKSLEETEKLVNRQMAAIDKAYAARMEKAAKIEKPEEKKSFLEAEIGKELKNKEGITTEINRLKKQIDELAPSWLTFGQIGKQEWQIAKGNLAEQEQRLLKINQAIQNMQEESKKIKVLEGFAIDPEAVDRFDKFFKKVKEDSASMGFSSQEAYEIDRAKKANLGKDPAMAKQIEEAERLLKLKEAHKLQDDINKTAEKLEKEAYAWGKTATEVEIYELKLRGANEAQLDHVRVLAEQVEQQKRADKEYERLKQRVNEAQKIMEDARSPEEKFIRTTQEMGKLLNENLIGFDDYSHAINKAYKEMEKITKETQKANKETEKMTKIEGAAFRSAEGFARMRQQLEDFNISKSKKVKDPKAEAGKVNLDDQLNQVIKQVIDPVRKNEGKEKPAQEVQNKLLEDIRNILKEQGKNPNAKIAPAGVGQ